MGEFLNMRFTKENTLQLKGIAVIFLLFHHLFNNSDMYKNINVNFFPLTEKIVNLFSWFGKNCVSIFVFLSAYGLTVSYMKMIKQNVTIAKWIKERLLKLYKGYWFVFALAFVICCLIDRMPIKVYGVQKIYGIAYVVLDMFGMSSFFHTPSMNGAWWYMSLADMIIMIVPIIDNFCRKYGWISTAVLTIIVPRILGIGFQGNNACLSFLFIAVCGVIFAENDYFTKCAEWLEKQKVILQLIVCIILFIGLYVTFKLYITCDVSEWTELNYGIVPLVWIIFSYLYISRIPIINRILKFIGIHSMNIFYVHIFFRNNYCYEFIYSFKNCFLIALVLFLLSVVASLGIEFLKKIIKYDYIWKQFENKIERIL